MRVDLDLLATRTGAFLSCGKNVGTAVEGTGAVYVDIKDVIRETEDHRVSFLYKIRTNQFQLFPLF